MLPLEFEVLQIIHLQSLFHLVSEVSELLYKFTPLHVVNKTSRTLITIARKSYNSTTFYWLLMSKFVVKPWLGSHGYVAISRKDK